MYLTLYKQNKTNLNKLNYNEIMHANILNNEKAYYKTTIQIKNPKPIHELPTTTQTDILTKAQYITLAWDILEPYEQNHENQYYEFQIPKRSGGLRTIDAPNEEFKQALSKVKDIFEQKIKCLTHTSAYAYTKQRSVLDALKIHQANNSNWYLKIDLTNFFPSCTPEIIFNQLTQLYPFYYFNKATKGKLKKIIKVCCLRNGLPQGTPISPLLTNLIMIPIDYAINQLLKNKPKEHFIYTRYADDILISSKTSFNWQELQDELQTLLTPFTIKRTKTRYGSKAGSNWNLGLMLNKDNNITLGSNKKKLLNAMLNNFIKDYKNNIIWSREDVYQLQGHLSYLNQIEPDYYNYIVQKYEKKYNITNYQTLIKNILN